MYIDFDFAIRDERSKKEEKDSESELEMAVEPNVHIPIFIVFANC